MALNGLSPELIVSLTAAPAGEPPPGVTPNYVDPPNLKVAVIVLTTICVVAMTFFVGMRLYTRHVILKSLWWDDLFSVLSWVRCVSAQS